MDPDSNDLSEADHALASVIARLVITLPFPVFVTELDAWRDGLFSFVMRGELPRPERALVEARRLLEDLLDIVAPSLLAANASNDVDPGALAPPIAARLGVLLARTLSAATNRDEMQWFNAANDTTPEIPFDEPLPVSVARDAFTERAAELELPDAIVRAVDAMFDRVA